MINQFARFNADGTLNPTFPILPIESDNILELDAFSDGTLLIAMQEQGVFLLSEDGTLDGPFFDELSLFDITRIDDSLLISGYDQELGYFIGLFNRYGENLESFTEGIVDEPVQSIKVLEDGSILLTGLFTEYNGLPFTQVVKIGSDGSLDQTFDIGEGAGENEVIVAASGDNSKVYLGGYFSTYDEVSTPGGFVRLNADGSVDNSFIYGPVGSVLSFTTQILELPDGKILVAGANVADDNNTIFRLNADGSIDNTFTIAKVDGEDGTRKMELIVLPNDSILVVGNLGDLELENPILGLLALDKDGNQVSGYPTFGQTAMVEDSYLLPDGKYFVRGNFISANGVLVPGITKLNTDGTLDESFSVDESVEIRFLSSFAFQEDGKVLIGGDLSSPDGNTSVIRLNSDGSYDNTLVIPNHGPARGITLDDNQNIYFIAGEVVHKYNTDGSTEIAFDNQGIFPNAFTPINLFKDGETIFVAGYNSDQNSSSVGGQVYRITLTGALESSFIMPQVPQEMLTIKRIGENELVMGGGFVTAFGTDDPNPLYFVNNAGEIIDQASIAILGDGILGRDQRYHDIIPVSENELLVLGQYKSINGFESEGISIISKNGQVNYEFDFDLDGFADKGFLDEVTGELTFFGSFTSLNDETRVSGGRILTKNDVPEITASAEFVTAEETALNIELSDLTVTDLDDAYPEGFALTIEEGENYTIQNNGILPAVDFNGTLNVYVSVTDGKDLSDPFLLQIEVTPINDVPVITGTSNSLVTLEDIPLTLSLDGFTVEDPDNQFPEDFTLTVLEGTDYQVNGNEITTTLNLDIPIVVNVSVSDGEDTSEPFEATLDITPVNDPPLITGTVVELITTEKKPVELSPADFVIEDPDNDLEDFSLELLAGEDYTLTGNTVTPNDGFLGTLMIDAAISDGDLVSESYTFNLIVTHLLTLDDQLDFKVYPNPFQNDLSLHLGDNMGNSSVQIFDMNGREVIGHHLIAERLKTMDLSSLKPGNYLLKIQTEGNKSFVIRIIKAN